MGSGSALTTPDAIIRGGHNHIAAADLDNNAITGAGLACIVSGGIQSCHNIKTFIGGSHNINPLYFDALNSAEKNQKTNRIQDNITRRTPSYHAEPLINSLFAALSINIWVRCL